MTTKTDQELLELESYDGLTDEEVRRLLDLHKQSAYGMGEESGKQQMIQDFLNQPIYEEAIARAEAAQSDFMAQVRALTGESHG